MSEFKNITDHPESEKIIGKLISGETAKQVSEYLKIKYSKTEEKHLRLSASLLEEFQEKYCNQFQFLNKLLEDEKSGKIDPKIAQSLLNNKTWRERLGQLADDKIDLNKKIAQFLYMAEQRTEQVFDKIQENARVTRDDYVLLKWFENLCILIEKAHKLNERPESMIQNNITIQMVEQHSIAFQEAIRDLLKELDPEMSTRFMEILTEKLSNVKHPTLPDYKPKTLAAQKEEVENLLSAEFDDIAKASNEE